MKPADSVNTKTVEEFCDIAMTECPEGKHGYKLTEQDQSLRSHMISMQIFLDDLEKEFQKTFKSLPYGEAGSAIRRYNARKEELIEMGKVRSREILKGEIKWKMN